MRCLANALALAVVLCLDLPIAADGCTKERDVTPAEKSVFDGWSAQLDRLLPKAPAGWKVLESKSFSPGRGTGKVCDDPGYKGPFRAQIDATYLPADAPEFARRKAEEDRKAATARLEAFTKQVQDAAAKGDAKRMTELSQQMASIYQDPALTAAGPRGESPRRASIRIEVNPNGYDLCVAAKAASVPGAAFASRWSGANCMRSVVSDGFAAGFGDWRPRMDFRKTLAGYSPPFDSDRPGGPRAKAYTASVVMFGDAGAIDALVDALDMKGLQALAGK